MPRLIMDLEAWMQMGDFTCVNTNDVLRRLLWAAIAVYISYFFGWRDVSLQNTKYQDFELAEDGTLLRLSEEFSKGVWTNQKHLFRRLEMGLSCLPGLGKGLQCFLGWGREYSQELASDLVV